MTTFNAYQYVTYTVVTDVPVEGYLATWPVPDTIAVEIIENGAEFEVVDGILTVEGEPI